MDKNTRNKRAYGNTLLVKAVEEINEQDAVEMMSNPNLDGQELSEVLNAHFTGSIKDAETDEPLKLSNKVVMAGIRNRFMQLSKENDESNNNQ